MHLHAVHVLQRALRNRSSTGPLIVSHLSKLYDVNAKAFADNVRRSRGSNHHSAPACNVTAQLDRSCPVAAFS